MKTLTILCLATLAISSCSISQNNCGNDKDQFLYNFHKLIKEVEEKDAHYRDEQWEDFDIRYNKLTKECYESYRDELTRADKEEFAENRVKYYALKYGRGLAREYEDHGEEIARAIEESIEEWVDTEGRDIAESVEKWMDTEGREIGRSLEDAIRKLEDNITEEKVNETLDRIGDFLKDLHIEIEKEGRREGKSL